MAKGAPDWVRQVLVTVIVENVPVVPAPATETAVGIVNRYSGTSVTYQELCKWTVSADTTGKLSEVSMIADNYDKAVWRLTIGTKTIMNEDTIQSALDLPFNDLQLAAGTEVVLSVRSSDGTVIVADGSISGKETG